MTDSALGVGPHTVTAVYQPANGNFFASSTSSGSLTQTVGLNLGLLVLDPTGKDALTDTGNGGIVVEDPVNGTDLGAAIVVSCADASVSGPGASPLYIYDKGLGVSAAAGATSGHL